MSTFSTDEQVYLRAPLCLAALDRINAERATKSISATTLQTYREEAQRQLREALVARGIVERLITDTTTLREPEVCLTAALLFEAATVRSAPQTAQPDVFATAVPVWRAAYATALAAVRITPLDRPKGASFEWGRG